MKVLILVGLVVFLAGCAGDGSSSTGSGGGQSNSGAGDLNTYKVDDGGVLNVYSYGTTSSIPPCDGTSQTAKAEGRCF